MKQSRVSTRTLTSPRTLTPVQITLTDDWQVLREARLAALWTSPESFLARYETEVCYREEIWRREISRGDWLVAVDDDSPIGLLGVTPEADVAPDERFLSYLWVHPAIRQCGLATILMTTALTLLGESSITRVWLWVLDGNHAAWSLYERLGFDRTGPRQPIPHDPSRHEERLAVSLRRADSSLQDGRNDV